MKTTASGLHRGNVGQIVTLDEIVADDDSESVVTGTLQAIERGPDTVTLTVGVQEYELELDETVDIVRSTVLAELFKMRDTSGEDLLAALASRTVGGGAAR